jgi:hypothetical protein
MHNKLSLLGFLGLLGLLGLVVDNPGFYGFLGFFGFFGFSKTLPDEMFRANVDKAARNGFLSGAVIFPIVVSIGAFTEDIALAYSVGFAVNFAVQMFVFAASLTLYERRGER